MSPEERDARIREILPRAIAREEAERERETPSERSSAAAADWTPPGWEVTVGDQYPANENGWCPVELKCRFAGCRHTVYTAAPPEVDPYRLPEMKYYQDHQAQHAPGRALDIEVDWIVSAECSACADGIGKVEEDSDGLVCMECRTTWNRDGTVGEIDEEASR